ncbi:MAG: hypothetical protein M1828_001475 [Chrysothrix sp. TS-e1954]|nr:MAG: hypothetical protein M1828_001475 [Chrysothrix sp. TS-e1954]
MSAVLTPTAPWTIRTGQHGGDIAAIIYADGRRVDLSPDGSFAESSAAQPLPPLGPPCSRRTRDRGASLTSNVSSASSTRETRDFFSSLNIQRDGLATSFNSADVGQPRHRLSFNGIAAGQPVDDSPADYSARLDDCELADPFPSQDQMVEGATGADANDVFQFEDFVDLGQLGDVPDTQVGSTANPYQEHPWAHAPFDDFLQCIPQQDSLFLNTLVSQSAPAAPTTLSGPYKPFSDDRAQPSIPITTKINGRPKAKPGRKPGTHLTAEKKAKTAYQRILGNCEYCKSGKRECDAGTPCKHCARQGIQCVRPMLQSLVNNMLSAQMHWHAYPRTPSSFFPSGYRVLQGSMAIPFSFAFGDPLFARVQVLSPYQDTDLTHKHVWYSSQVSLLVEPSVSEDLLLPVQFQHADQLPALIDRHLEDLVQSHLTEFKLYRSRFQIFDSIVRLYHHYCQANSEYAELLQDALKLLVLVHAGETFVDANDPQILQLLHRFVPGYDGTQMVVPCLLRAQLGSFLPRLARSLLKNVLDRLIQICGNKRSDQHAIVLAAFALVLMTLESIMYHASRFSFHHYLGDDHAGIEDSYAASMANGEKSASDLLRFYKDGFETCHRMMAKVMEYGNASPNVPDRFLAELSQAVRSASTYLHEKGETHVDALQDVSQLFDRLLAKLFLMQ